MFMMSPKMYDFLKKLVEIILPALSAFYIGLAELWGLPGSLQVAGTLALIATFLGVCLGISSHTYNKLDKAFDGNVVITTTEEGKKLFSLEVNGDPLELEQQGAIRFKVKTVEETA
jgi:hypothetical protein